MIKCPKCGTMNNSKSKFCVHCGHPLHAKAVQATKQQPKQPQQIKCPNCGKMNDAGAKFCRFCGYSFITKRTPQSNPQQNTMHHSQANNMNNTYQVRPHQNYTMPNYQQQWKRANQSFNGVANYSNNFFKWVSDSFFHPLKTHYGHPYFGVTTFLLIAIVSWFAEIIANGSPKISGEMGDLLGYLPIKDYLNNVYNIMNVPCELILLLLAAVAYWVIGFVAYSMTHANKENPFAYANRLASANIVTLIIAVLMIVASLLDKGSIIWVLVVGYHYFRATAIISTTITDSNKNDARCFYISGMAYLAYLIVAGLFATIAAVMLA